MPNFEDASSNQTTTPPTFGFLGGPTQPPPPPSTPATVGTGSPTVATNPQPGQGVALDLSGKLAPSVIAQALLVVTTDPAAPVVGQAWYRSDTSQLCIRHDSATTKRVTLA